MISVCTKDSLNNSPVLFWVKVFMFSVEVSPKCLLILVLSILSGESCSRLAKDLFLKVLNEPFRVGKETNSNVVFVVSRFFFFFFTRWRLNCFLDLSYGSVKLTLLRLKDCRSVFAYFIFSAIDLDLS